MSTRNLRAVPDQPGRVVAYIRVSALMGRGGETFHSPDVQLDAIRRLTAGMREVAVIDDIDQTGRNFNREGIDKIRALAEARQIDVVAVYDLSRVGRNVREALGFIDHLAKHGVGVISSSENIDTSTPAGRLMLQQFLSFAEFYSNTMGRNWSAVLLRRSEQGFLHGRALGYVNGPAGATVHPVEGPAMASAFQRYAAGDPVGEICRTFVATVGRSITRNMVKRALKNPIYLGKSKIHGRTFPGRHEPLVDEQTWQVVQDRIIRDHRTPSRHLAPTWSMVGITFCHSGHRMHRETDTAGREVVERVRCERVRVGYVERCRVGQPRMDDVEAEVLRRVAEHVRLLRDDVNAQAATMARTATARVEKVDLETQLKAVRTAMAKVTTRWGMGQLDDATYDESMQGLRESETALLTGLAAASQVVRLPSPKLLADAGERMLAMWPDMTIPERNRVLRTVVERIVIRPSERWHEPAAARTQVFLL